MSSLRDMIWEKMHGNAGACIFMEKIRAHFSISLFGGAVRDFLEGNFNSLRDLDFVIHPIQDDLDIAACLPTPPQAKITKNRFNGYKVQFGDDITIDIWKLEDTWAFRHDKAAASLEKLLTSVYLNIDALVYSLAQDRFVDHCDQTYQDIRKSNLLDLVCVDTPFEQLNLLRALVLRRKYSMTLSRALQQRFSPYLTAPTRKETLDAFMKLQIKHYGMVLLDRATLALECSTLHKQM